MSAAIRNGSVWALALGAVVGFANIGAASDNSPPAALGGAQLNGVTSTPSGEETYLPEANISIDFAIPLTSCCVPLTGERRFACYAPTTQGQCVGMSGIPVRSCGACISIRPSVSTEGEVDTMVDDSPIADPAGATPIEPGYGSAWNLLAVTLFLASL